MTSSKTSSPLDKGGGIRGGIASSSSATHCTWGSLDSGATVATSSVLFCAEHHYSDFRNCSYDYKAIGREAIARENPVVKATKIVKGSLPRCSLVNNDRFRFNLGVALAVGSIQLHLIILELLNMNDFGVVVDRASTALNLLSVALELLFEECVDGAGREANGEINPLP
ncbi:hypothetical protein JHK85_007301 [Glycine max]|nr:hypothetical protein JHK85_007301 [Glycine max]KAG5071880.1 hypothetical protein JHK86_007091 [Glycine max]